MTLDALIASDKDRTQQTLQPLAEAQAAGGNPLEIQTTDDTSAAAAAAILALPPGSRAVVAHHSYTLMGIISELGATENKLPFPGQHDNVWVITVGSDRQAAVVPLKYLVLPDCPE